MEESLYYNGDIITLEEPLYVEALLIKDGKIVRTGNLEELKKKAGPEAIMIDLKGKTLMPSFIDAHSHFIGYASSLSQVKLTGVISLEEIEERIRTYIQKNKIAPGKWIQADGYDQNNLPESKHPDSTILDRAAPENPVLIKHQSGHMGVLNKLAQKELGIGKEYLEETEYIKCIQNIPLPSWEEWKGYIRMAQKRYFSYGITTAQEGYIVEALAPILKGIMNEKMLQIDLIGYLDAEQGALLKQQFPECFKNYVNHFKAMPFR